MIIFLSLFHLEIKKILSSLDHWYPFVSLDVEHVDMGNDFVSLLVVSMAENRSLEPFNISSRTLPIQLTYSMYYHQTVEVVIVLNLFRLIGLDQLLDWLELQ